MIESFFRTFTASQIGVALGKTKRRILQALEHIKPTGQIIARGQAADAWSLEQLPATYRDELSRKAMTQGCKDVFHLLNTPRERWQPCIPLNRVADHHIEKASRLRSALKTSLALKEETDALTVRRCLNDFRREFGGVSERHWRRLLKRTIQRDAGEENFDDLTLYLDENLTSRPEAHGKPVIAKSANDRVILDQLSQIKNPASPSDLEAELAWTIVCEELHAMTLGGENERNARRKLVTLLTASGVRLSKNTDALKKLLKLKYTRWIEGGKTLAALKDKRGENSGYHRAPEIPEECRLQLVAHARLNCGGRISQAWREINEAGQLPDSLHTHYISNPANKSFVPGSIRKIVAPDVKRLEAIHHGPREHKLKGAHHTRDWSGVAAGEWFQSDDCTAPVYFWTHTTRGIEIMRGQFLPMIDERTTFILGFVLILERNYNSLAIRSLITRVCTEHGLPRSGFSFERGIWQSSQILTGSKTAVPWEVADAGLRGLGLRFRHAQLPRGKVIENTLGLMQNQMERIPGYCGRDEKNDKYERLQRSKLDVEAGRTPADEVFLSESEICEAYFRICEEFNDTPQQGRKLAGLTPREGWEKFQSTPLARFDEKCLHLLAHDRRKVKIGSNGITIRIGKQRFNYKGEETGRRQGEEVLAWFNPDLPDALPCTDLNQRNVFTVPRSYELPAVGASAVQFAEEEALIAAHNGYATRLYRIVKNALPQSSYRQNFVDSKTASVGAEIAAQREKHAERKQVETRQRKEVAGKAARLQIPVTILNPRSEETGRGLDMLLAAMKDRKSLAVAAKSKTSD